VLLGQLRGDRGRLVALLVGSGLIFTWGLDASGFANSYYSAAALAGTPSQRGSPRGIPSR
jgi:hypothetical protein